ncbi:MAG: signal peptidase II [Pirellulaceae bacterium]|nr:signal peptidase II [Pirellulaceae bacterium]MDP6556129.1 signal peptidase II [Pirellulaceae bacterium]
MKAADPTDRNQIPASRYVLFSVIAVVGCAVDLGTKQAIFAWRGPPPPIGPPNNEWWLIEPYIGIETAVNIGALFGLGAGAGRYFAALSVVAALGILVWLFRFGAARDRWLTVALGCVMAGILGNLYDRMGFWYETGMPVQWQSGVRDWILFRYGAHTWPNFNIADSMLVCGAIMLMWQAFMDPGAKPANASSGPKAE